MNERDSRRYEERQRQRQASEQGTGSEYGARHAREDREDAREGRYGGGSQAGQAARMGRQYGSDLGREESDWSQGRREAQRWGEQGTYDAQGSSEFERHGSNQDRDRAYSGQFSDRVRDEYAQGRDYVSQERNRAYGNQDYSNQRGSGTQAYGQGEQSYGTHGYVGSGREFRGYEGGEAGRRAGGRHWERGFGEGYGMSSGYADEQAYDHRYGASGYATGYPSSPREEHSQRAGYGATSSPRDYSRNYRGMGPKAYTRSDERVLEDVNERLTDDDYLDASDITVRCVNGIVTLEGTVADRWMKHRAEDLADASSGVKQVDNRIQVQSQFARPGGEQKPADSTSAQGRSRQAGSAGTATGAPTRGGGDTGTSSQH